MSKNEYGYTEEEWENLEDFEREAIMEEPEGAAGVEPEITDSADNETTEPEETGDNQAEQDSDDDSASEDDGSQDEDTPTRDDGKEPDADDESEGTDDQNSQYVPSLRVELPDDIDDQLEKIAEEKKKLRALYNDGEIDADEYESKRDELDEQRFSLREKMFKAQIANEMREDRWLNHDVPAFLAENPQYKPDSTLFRMLDERVKLLQGKLAAEGKDPLVPSVLRQADRELKEELAKELGLQVDTKKGKSAGGVPAAQKNVPPSLANVPAADMEDTSGGKWAALDRLADSDPEAYEEQLSRMSETELNDYLQASTK